MTQITVCRTDEVPADSALCKRLPDGLSVAVAKLQNGGGYVAFENRCPHAAGPLGLGKLKDDAVVCPWHFFRFDLKTGKPVGWESVLQLRLFPTQVQGGEVRIEV